MRFKLDPHNPSLPLLQRSARQFLRVLTEVSVEQNPWIVEVGRIRIHQTDAGAWGRIARG